MVDEPKISRRGILGLLSGAFLSMLFGVPGAAAQTEIPQMVPAPGTPVVTGPSSADADVSKPSNTAAGSSGSAEPAVEPKTPAEAEANASGTTSSADGEDASSTPSNSETPGSKEHTGNRETDTPKVPESEPSNRKQRDIYLLDTHIAGTTYIPHIDTLDPLIRIGNLMKLEREPGNAFDSNAILIRHWNGSKLGYVPRVENSIPARLMDAGYEMFALVTNKEWRGSWLRIEIAVFMSDAVVIDQEVLN